MEYYFLLACFLQIWHDVPLLVVFTIPLFFILFVLQHNNWAEGVHIMEVHINVTKTSYESWLILLGGGLGGWEGGKNPIWLTSKPFSWAIVGMQWQGGGLYPGRLHLDGLYKV